MTTLAEQFGNRTASRRAFVEALAILGIGAAGVKTAEAAEVALATGEGEASEAESSTFVFAYLKLKPGTALNSTKYWETLPPVWRSTAAGSFVPRTLTTTVLRTRLSIYGNSRTPMLSPWTFPEQRRTRRSRNCFCDRRDS